MRPLQNRISNTARSGNATIRIQTVLPAVRREHLFLRRDDTAGVGAASGIQITPAKAETENERAGTATEAVKERARAHRQRAEGRGGGTRAGRRGGRGARGGSGFDDARREK